MATKFTKAELQALKGVGTAASISQRIHTYTEAVNRVSSRHKELVARYPRHWVALYDGEVICTGESLDELLRQCDERKLERDAVVIRFLDTEKQILIL